MPTPRRSSAETGGAKAARRWGKAKAGEAAERRLQREESEEELVFEGTNPLSRQATEPQAATAPRERVVVEGLLWKRDRNKGGKRLLKAMVGAGGVRWQLRWFRVVEGRDALEWFHDNGEISTGVPCGAIALSDHRVELVPASEACGRSNCFALRHRRNRGDEMVLAATSAPDVANWLQKLMPVTFADPQVAAPGRGLGRSRSDSLRSGSSRASFFVEDAGCLFGDDDDGRGGDARPPPPPPPEPEPEAASRMWPASWNAWSPRSKMQSAFLATAEGQASSLGAFARRAKQLAERHVPQALRAYTSLDRGVEAVMAMATEDRLSEAAARDLLVELALQNREVVAAFRDADESKLETLSAKIRDINAHQSQLVGRKDKGPRRPSSARFSLYAAKAAAETAAVAPAPAAPPPVVVTPARCEKKSALVADPAATRARAPGARVRFAPVVAQRLFTYSLAATVPSDAGPAIGLGQYVSDEAYDLDAFEAFRGGTTAAQVDASMAAFVADETQRYLRSLDGDGDDDDDDDESDESDESESDDGDGDWPENWRYPRETFQDDGAIPPEERARLLAASGHRRVSISLNAAQLLSIAQSRKRNSRARAARRIIDGDDPDEVMAWLEDMEKAASVEPYATHWRATARKRAEARRKGG